MEVFASGIVSEESILSQVADRISARNNQSTTEDRTASQLKRSVEIDKWRGAAVTLITIDYFKAWVIIRGTNQKP